MGHHINKNGQFKSDKYPWCPEGFVAFKFSDPKARPLIRRYANATDDVELANDLFTACNNEEKKRG